MRKRKTKTGKQSISEAAADFLFAELDADYQTWSKSYELPAFISNNLNKTKRLRLYQTEAVKRFIYLFEHERSAAAHWLFNMATGSGKTLVMAACVLYLYEQGYRNFLFLVNQTQIKDQAKKCLTEYKYSKYLFNPNGVKFCGRKVEVHTVERLQDASPYGINFLFFSTPLLYNRLNKKSENALALDDFIADTDKDKNKRGLTSLRVIFS
ncbi:MAG: DEAD/DEAH box helicase family protein [Planctomycetaceae bacterium]|jgi:type III restriction enzyme|nr:DEAD/DEAH box helicase family protein [Planctomycetaceae bacterium]